ncbi:MAG: hypothetical protein IH602_07075 [Bryobacteraceae bacterium]|nr:hypothetical protein [Bryobacteraceae bacterium]
MRLLFILVLLAAGPAALAADPTAGTSAASQPFSFKRNVSITLQSGFADTFQLTLGGMFGDGPAWQNRVTVTASEVLRKGDSVSLSGWNTHDAPSHVNSWTAGVSYRTRVIATPKHLLYLAGGVQRWRFPSVMCGAQDWLGAWQLQYQTRVKRLPVMLTQDSWTIFHSPLKKGSLLHTQLYTEHSLVERHDWKLALRHGPQHTYSWNFYGTNGHRVMRYAGFLLLSWHKTTLEAGYRQQVALQKRIPDNRYWSVLLSRTF